MQDMLKHGHTYKQRLALAEERTLWTWRDAIETTIALIIILAVFLAILNFTHSN